MRNIKEYLATGPEDKTTKTRNIRDRSIMSTLSGHRDAISARTRLFDVLLKKLIIPSLLLVAVNNGHFSINILAFHIILINTNLNHNSYITILTMILLINW